ncbi:MFS transporter [Brachybacterium muris]|uniref:MFS transporter n=1 Tax=Brachybacterium muris TaxID=219301 RepID=UPI0021A3C65D|nr:MFS transporter [Brachybacterium muris]MCT1429946.1 MFS transporter [Brachybacterium muris]
MVSSSSSAIARYRSLPTIASGSWMALAMAARAPYAMIPLGTMTAITVSTGSIATGGLASGLVAAASAVAGPLIGRAADRSGQRRVLTILTPLNAIALGLLLLAALQAWDGPLLWAICLFTGGTAVPVGSFTRARWVELARDPKDLGTALSYESTVDELSFVLGPALVGIAASTAFSAAPLAIAAALVALAGIPFALTTPRSEHAVAIGAGAGAGATERTGDGTTEATAPHRASTRTVTGEMPAIGSVPSDAPFAEHRTPAPVSASTPAPSIKRVLLAVLPAIVVMVCIGTFFGSVQAGTTERADLLGAAGSAGIVYAFMGLTSALTALLVVLLPDSVTLAARVLVGGAGMAVFIALTAFMGSLTMTGVTLMIAGLFVGPTMVTAFSLTERRTPPGGTGVAMTSMQSSVTVGQAAGASLGGALAASIGAQGAYGLATLVSIVIALVGGFVVLRRR